VARATDPSQLNAQLPARFFALQDELRGQLQTLERAAQARDANATADALAASMKSCVACHDAYLTGK
jgi:hypothetical protein